MNTRALTVALSILAIAVVGCGDEEIEIRSVESAEAALGTCTQHFDAVVSSPAGWSTSFSSYNRCRDLHLSGTAHEDIEYEATGDFPQWTGSFRDPAKFQAAAFSCSLSTVSLFVQRVNGAVLYSRSTPAVAHVSQTIEQGETIYHVDECSGSVQSWPVTSASVDETFVRAVTGTPLGGNVTRVNRTWGSVSAWIK